jgi:hypothetical protein
MEKIKVGTLIRDMGNYEDPNFQKCWSLENLQPLEAMMNVRKSNKIKT